MKGNPGVDKHLRAAIIPRADRVTARRRVSRTQKLEPSYRDHLVEVGAMEGGADQQAVEPEKRWFFT